MKTLKEALFSKKNIKNVKDTYTIDEVIEEKLQIFVVIKNISIIFFDCYNIEFRQLIKGNKIDYFSYSINKNYIKRILKDCCMSSSSNVVYYNIIDHKTDTSDIRMTLKSFDSESSTYTTKDIINKVKEESGVELVEINIVE